MAVIVWGLFVDVTKACGGDSESRGEGTCGYVGKKWGAECNRARASSFSLDCGSFLSQSVKED